MSARIAETLGFLALDLPGSALGCKTTLIESNLGLEDMVEALRRITSAVNIPVMVDVGAGFGEPAHLLRTVRYLEQAGADSPVVPQSKLRLHAMILVCRAHKYVLNCILM